MTGIFVSDTPIHSVIQRMIALFGGTFNPIHAGHINLALEVQAAFTLQCVEFVPSFIPVHRKEPETAAHMRRQLIEITINAHTGLKLNSCELDRQGHSYTVDTLTAIRSGAPEQSICWLMGADSFNSFQDWKNPAGILQLANLIVCARPGVALDKSIFSSHYLKPGETLSDYSAGKISFFQMQPNNCSSSLIRQRLQQNLPVTGCLSQPVLEFIQRNKLYKYREKAN